MLSYVVALGARNVVLLDRDAKRRRSVKWTRQHSYIDYLLGDCDDLRIEIVHADVGEYDHVTKAVEQVSQLGMPPIGSVFHLAGGWPMQTESRVGALQHSSSFLYFFGKGFRFTFPNEHMFNG